MIKLITNIFSKRDATKNMISTLFAPLTEIEFSEQAKILDIDPSELKDFKLPQVELPKSYVTFVESSFIEEFCNDELELSFIIFPREVRWRWITYFCPDICNFIPSFYILFVMNEHDPPKRSFIFITWLDSTIINR